METRIKSIKPSMAGSSSVFGAQVYLSPPPGSADATEPESFILLRSAWSKTLTLGSATLLVAVVLLIIRIII